MHRTRLLFAAALIAALMLPTAASAGSARDRATGGGQIFFETNEDGDVVDAPADGAGSTIAFTAQEFADGDRGQVQYIERTGGTGQDQTRGHYDVSCLEVLETTAYIAASKKNGDSKTSDFIYLEVIDNGEGNAADADIVTVSREADPDEDGADGQDGDGGGTNACDVPEGGTISLARGNAQVYDAP